MDGMHATTYDPTRGRNPLGVALDIVNVFGNPIFIKCARARLRWKHVLSWGTVVLTITAFMCVLFYLTLIERTDIIEEDAARSLLPALVWTQFVLLMGFGTGAVASGLAKERLGGLLNYQRMTPLSPTAKIVGYLFGLPVREYFLFALTLPFLAFAVIKGNFPLEKIAQFYLVFFTSVWVYHMTAMVAGMASSRPMYASGISIGLVIVLYFILPRLEIVGFKFFEHLTMLPAFIGLIMEELGTINMRNTGDPFWDVSRIGDVAFYDWKIGQVPFTLMVQGFLLAFMFIVVHRKWKDEFSHPFSKASAFLGFSGVMIFLIGNIWPIVSSPEIFEEFILRLEMDPQRVPPSFPLYIIMLLFMLISGFLALVLITLITPSKHTYTKGLQLARKLGHNHVGGNSDAASSLSVTVGMIAVMSLSCIAIIALAWRTGRYFQELPPWWVCAAPLVLSAAVFLFIQGLRERFSMRVFLVSTFLLWAVPFFVSMIVMIAEDQFREGMYLGLPCPPIAQAIAASHFFETALNVNDYQMETFPPWIRDEILSELPAMTWLGIVIYTLLAAGLQLELFRWKRIVRQQELALPVIVERPEIVGPGDMVQLAPEPAAG